ncbi:MAG: hypothetical protein RR436_02350 [Clostridia bacterium]
MKCENCGNENLENAKICAFCDKPLAIEEKTEKGPLDSDKVNEKVDTILNFRSDEPTPKEKMKRVSKKKIEEKYDEDEDTILEESEEYEYYDESEEHVSIGGWMGIMCLNLIPILGTVIYLILILVWAFGGTKKVSLKNYARANLLLILIAGVLLVGLYFALNALGINPFQIATELIQDFIK